VQHPEFFGIEVQVLVIEFVQYLCFNNLTQLFHIVYITCFLIYGAGKFYDKLIVVPMEVGVTAQAKDLSVLLIVPGRVIQAVRRIKMLFSANGYSHKIKLLRALKGFCYTRQGYN